MSVVDEKSIFTAMKQEGPFAVQEGLTIGYPFSGVSREWARGFFRDRLNLTKYRAVRGQVFDLLQIDGFDEIAALIRDPPLLPAVPACVARREYRSGHDCSDNAGKSRARSV